MNHPNAKLETTPSHPHHPQKESRSTLRLVAWETTRNCNLSCVHCRASATLGPQVYWVVFALVGLSPVTLRSLNNYTLEVCTAEDHPKYLSTLGLCLACPLLLSPLVGSAIDIVGFDQTFIIIAALVFAGWLMTWRLYEPRHDHA